MSEFFYFPGTELETTLSIQYKLYFNLNNNIEPMDITFDDIDISDNDVEMTNYDIMDIDTD